MFKTTRNSGFQMTFDNGWTISVQFGYGTYSDNRNHPDGYDFSRKEKDTQSSDAEIGIWDANGEWFDFDSGTVKGYCSTNEVAEWIAKVSQFKVKPMEKFENMSVKESATILNKLANRMVASDHDIPFDYLPEYQELLDECRTMLEDLPSEEIDALVKEYNITYA
jgi:hypothetical protein